MIVPAILCGGSGTRLWPLSRTARPKQFHPLLGERSLLADTIARAALAPGAAAPVLIAGESMREAVVAEAPAGARVVLEPAARNTAPAAALAAFAALETSPEAIVLLLPSDHHVGDAAAFAAAVSAGATLASQGWLVTFGIAPTEPHTGYGYITAGAKLGAGFAVERFTEKPKLPAAQALLAGGRSYWNAGIFMFRASVYLEELRRLAPTMHAAVLAAWTGRSTSGAAIAPDAAAWDACPSDSIDYAVAEKTERAAVIPVSMAWSDVGSWSALYDIATRDAANNAIAGDVLLRDSRGCYVRASSRLVALVGVEDLVVVETPDAVVVLPRARAQEIKDIVEALKAAGRSDLT